MRCDATKLSNLVGSGYHNHIGMPVRIGVSPINRPDSLNNWRKELFDLTRRPKVFHKSVGWNSGVGI